jgi:hypothetical protein
MPAGHNTIIMETAFTITHYIAFAILAIAGLGGLPRYIYLRIKTDSLRDAQHYEVCLISMVLVILTAAILTCVTFTA